MPKKTIKKRYLYAVPLLIIKIKGALESNTESAEQIGDIKPHCDVKGNADKRDYVISEIVSESAYLENREKGKNDYLNRQENSRSVGKSVGDVLNGQIGEHILENKAKRRAKAANTEQHGYGINKSFKHGTKS